MAKGRKKDPVKTKAARGTLRKDRLPENMPEPSREEMRPAALVNEKVRECFDLLHGLATEMGNNSATFGPALSLAALHMSRVIRLAEEIDAEKDIYETDGRNGLQKKANPKVPMLYEDSRQLRALLIEFGMTPAAIQKVGAAIPPEKTSPFARFKGNG